ncbi:hypothetical protein UB31_10660 [Bradyrhizobium sp. LTSP849]|jgi:hypothetical protein|nr:hypothetical protein UB31_10660 [Bradyrhizobium sp. LTSP849]
MGLRLWLLVVATAAVAHAILLAVDHQIEAGVDRLSDYRGATSAVPDLKSVTARSAYMRNER